MIQVATVSELREVKRKLIEIEDKKIILFFISGEVFAIDAVCPHQGGLLEEGELIDREVICPGHAFTYDLETGMCLNLPSYRVHKYPVKLEGEKVLIDLDD